MIWYGLYHLFYQPQGWRKKKEGKCRGQKQIISRKRRMNDQLIDRCKVVVERRQTFYTLCIGIKKCNKRDEKETVLVYSWCSSLSLSAYLHCKSFDYMYNKLYMCDMLLCSVKERWGDLYLKWCYKCKTKHIFTHDWKKIWQNLINGAHYKKDSDDKNYSEPYHSTYDIRNNKYIANSIRP